MRHEREWYVCDRCGTKIESDEIPSRASWIHKLRRICLPPTTLHTLVVDRAGYVNQRYLGLPVVDGIEITEYYHSKYGNIHLCGKCRKAFEEFMKNK